jgi:hypothetical protein
MILARGVSTNVLIGRNVYSAFPLVVCSLEGCEPYEWPQHSKRSSASVGTCGDLTAGVGQDWGSSFVNHTV